MHQYPADTGVYHVSMVAVYTYFDPFYNNWYACMDTIREIRYVIPENIQLLSLVPNARIAVILPFNGTLYLFDHIGRTIETRTVGSRRQEFDISGLASGAYYFVFYNGSIKQTINFLKY